MVMAQQGDEKSRRFYLFIAAQVVVFFGLFGLTLAAADRMANGFGVALAIVGGVCLGLAFLLARAVIVDVMSLRALKERQVHDVSDLRPGEVAAFSGVARTEGEALTSPFGGHRCCAYSYLVAGRQRARGSDSVGTRRANSLQGFALAPTVVEGESMNLRLRALPEVETDLREVKDGGEWGEKAAALVRAAGEKGAQPEREGFGSLFLAQTGPVDAGSREVYFGSYGPAEDLNVQESWVPADEPICLIGTAEVGPPGLSGRRTRFGPNLIAYRGTPEQVIERIGKENRGWMKTLYVLAAIAVIGLLPPFLPVAWVSWIPVLGKLVGSD